METVRQVQQRLASRFSITFGQTETCGPSTQTRPEGTLTEQVETIGQPLPHTEAKVIDPAAGEIVPIGAEGEICTRGPMTMLGYLDSESGNAEMGVGKDGWLHYGDIGTMDDNGLLRISRRLKDTIIRGGENVSPRQIEEVLISHPAVSDVAVIGITDPKWGESIATVVRTDRTGDEALVEELKQYCGGQLARFKIPALWRFVEDFPLTPSGKIQKFKLRTWLAEDEKDWPA